MLFASTIGLENKHSLTRTGYNVSRIRHVCILYRDDAPPRLVDTRGTLFKKTISTVVEARDNQNLLIQFELNYTDVFVSLKDNFASEESCSLS